MKKIHDYKNFVCAFPNYSKEKKQQVLKMITEIAWIGSYLGIDVSKYDTDWLMGSMSLITNPYGSETNIQSNLYAFNLNDNKFDFIWYEAHSEELVNMHHVYAMHINLTTKEFTYHEIKKEPITLWCTGKQITHKVVNGVLPSTLFYDKDSCNPYQLGKMVIGKDFTSEESWLSTNMLYEIIEVVHKLLKGEANGDVYDVEDVKDGYIWSIQPSQVEQAEKFLEKYYPEIYYKIGELSFDEIREMIAKDEKLKSRTDLIDRLDIEEHYHRRLELLSKLNKARSRIPVRKDE